MLMAIWGGAALVTIDTTKNQRGKATIFFIISVWSFKLSIFLVMFSGRIVPSASVPLNDAKLLISFITISFYPRLYQRMFVASTQREGRRADAQRIDRSNLTIFSFLVPNMEELLQQ